MGPWLVEVFERSELDSWIGGGASTAKVLMMVRGDGEGVRMFLPNALDAAKLDPCRVVLWIRDDSLLTEQENEELFAGDPANLAVVVAADRSAQAWVPTDRLTVEDATFAFDQAEQS